ncbi:MAG: LysR substrate-binding domain-containing protein [Pseudomonadota bacterium]
MPVRFQRHDTLRLFVEVARHPSLSAAAEALNMTKGAVSYQIKALEDELQIQLLLRKSRGVELTKQGKNLLEITAPQFATLEERLDDFLGARDQELTVGLSSYFAARWLSPRLMSFMGQFPDVRLRLQPMTKLFDLEDQGVDLAIRWGSGQWDDAQVEPFLEMPTWPVGTSKALERIEADGIEAAFSNFTLLRDHDDSNAWSDWKEKSDLSIREGRDTLIIPDPNVRVQAVIDGQGIALMDDLIAAELKEGSMVRLTATELSDYGYFLVEPFGVRRKAAAVKFCNWIQKLSHK